MTPQRRFRVDAHIHVAGDHPSTIALLDELDVKLLDICVAMGSWRETDYPTFRRLAREYPERYAWCTSFDLPDWQTPDGEYAAGIIGALERDLDAGAVAVKAWKNIGMELRRPDGSFVHIDDPLFDPLYRYLATRGVPMIMHMGEPLACWLPMETPSPHQHYYREHPEWHMHGREDVPSHEELMAARDRVLEHHPDLRVVGAHLGSLEHDVTQVAQRLDRYPNFAVDISARLDDLIAQECETVREFFCSYPERIIFGTDVVSRSPSSSLSPPRRRSLEAELRATWERYWSYLETPQTSTPDGRTVPGLELPGDVLDRVYVENARSWFPGLIG